MKGKQRATGKQRGLTKNVIRNENALQMISNADYNEQAPLMHSEFSKSMNLVKDMLMVTNAVVTSNSINNQKPIYNPF